jgi:hypothetical protein
MQTTLTRAAFAVSGTFERRAQTDVKTSTLTLGHTFAPVNAVIQTGKSHPFLIGTLAG